MIAGPDKSTNMAHIMNLPNELLYEIAQLSTSDYRTLASLMSVNRLLRDITRRHLVKKVCTSKYTLVITHIQLT